MARPGISKSIVFEKANQLVGEGIDPTIEQVRLRLGTGSNSTIAGFLREWRSFQTGEKAIELSEELPSEIVGLMKGLWQRLITEANSKIEIIKQDLEQKLAELNTELATAKQNQHDLQQQLTELKDQKDDLFEKKRTLDECISKNQQEIAGLHEKQSSLMMQLDEKQQLISELRRLNRQTQENLEHYREQIREQRALDEERFMREKQTLEANLKELQQLLNSTQQEIIEWKKNHERMAAEKSHFEEKYKETILHIEQLQQNCNQLSKERDIQVSLLANERAQVESLQKKMDEQNKILIELQKEKAVLSQQQLESREKVAALTEQNQALSKEKWEWVEMKAKLMARNNKEPLSV